MRVCVCVHVTVVSAYVSHTLFFFLLALFNCVSAIALKKRRGAVCVLDCEIDLRAFITHFNRIEWSGAERSGVKQSSVLLL